MNQEILEEKDQFNGKIRPIDISKDAQNLANYFNAIDDLWPGSWTRGVKYDSIRAREFVERRNALQTYVAFDPEERLVGFCSIHKRMEEENVSYIGILGVHPNVLSKKYGKYLLLEAIDFSVKNGDIRQDLHTWASNMKAVPLYKKIGLQWVPKTSVYMQNYLPGILQNSFCKPFFQKHPDWYLNHKRDLVQAPDEIKKDNMDVFLYRFEGNETDFLEVTIDRYSRAICGITRQLNGEMISLSLQQTQHEILAGLKQNLKLKIQNNTKNELKLVVAMNPSKEIDMIFPQEVYTIPNGSSSIECSYKVHSTTPDSKDSRKTPSIKSEIILDNEFVSLEVGMKTQQIIDIYSPSMTHWFPQGQQEIPINIQNRSKDSIEGKLLVWTEQEIEIEKTQFSISLTSEQNIGLRIPVNINRSISSNFIILNCQLNINGLRSRIFHIPFTTSRYPSVAGGVLKDKKQIILHNQYLKAVINLEGAALSLYKDDPSQMGLGLGTFDYGPPFGFSEFSQTEFEYELIQEQNLIRATLFQKSRSQPHLIFKRVFELRNGETHIAIWEEIENLSTHSVITTTISTPHFARGLNMPIGMTYLVLDGELISGPCFNWPANEGDLPKGTDRYEPWIAIQTGETVFYHIFEPVSTLADPSKSQMMTLEKTFEIAPLKTKKGPISWLGIRIGGKYNQIRDLASYLTKNQIKELLPEVKTPVSVLDISIPQEELIIDQKIKQLAFSVRSFRNLSLSGKITFETDNRIQLTPNILDIENLQLNNQKTLNVEIRILEGTPSGLYLLKAEFQSPLIIKEFKYNLLIIDSTKEPQIRELPTVEGKRLWSIENDFLMLQTSPDFAASLMEIKEGDNKHLISNFPAYQPSFFSNQDPGGMHTIILGNNDDLNDTDYLKEKYEATIVKSDLWYGIEYSSRITHRKSLKGLLVTYGYEILKGKSNIIRVRINLANPTTATFNCISFTLLKYGLNDSVEKLLCKFDHLDNETTIYPCENPIILIGLGHEEMKVLSFENQNKRFSLIKKPRDVKLFPLGFGDKLLGGGVISHWVLHPDEKKEISFYIVINGNEEYIKNITEFVSKL